MKTKTKQDTQERDGLGKWSSRNEAGYVSLACKIVEQAVEDYKLLEDAGYIRGGIAIWPDTATKIRDFTSKQEVQELVEFFRHGHAKSYLELINSKIDPEAMLHSLGITKQKKP
mgnify:CR=1 FL=1